MFFRKKSSPLLAEVLEGCLAGKASAQKQLFHQFYGLGKKIALRYAANQEEAEEMVNDGFLKIFTKIQHYAPEQPFEAWFRTVMIRTCIDYYRRHADKTVYWDIQDVQVGYEPTVVDQLSADDILALVQRLPPAYRTVFSLFVVEGYAHAEIAEMLGIQEGTSRSNLAKARMKLQEWLKPENSPNHV